MASAPEAIIGTTLDGVITSWNPGAAALYGYAAEEVAGRSIAVLLPADRVTELALILGQIRRGGRVDHYETRRVRKDGSLIDVSISIFPVHDESGAIAGAASIARDITERIWAEAERRASEARLYESERMEGMVGLAGAIAQDLGKQFGAIAAHAASLGAAGDAGVQAHVQRIYATAERGAWLVRQLRLFSRWEPAKPRQVELGDVLAGTRDLLKNRAGDDIEVRLDTGPDVPGVLADPGQMEQVLLNLAANACDAMPHGGTLTVSTGIADWTEEHDAEWPPAQPGPYVELSVSDTGYGMDAETMHRSVEPFFTTKPRGQGAGLGLSMVYGVVTQTGGGLAIDSAEAAGTTVHIYLPAIAVPAPVRPARVSLAAPGDGETILVVDREPAILEITARILRHNGYHVHVARTCTEALALISAHDVRLLLADALMAGNPGSAFADRAREAKPGLRVLRMLGTSSGRAEPGLASDAEVPFIRKPFTAPDLLEQVRAALTAALGRPAKD